MLPKKIVFHTLMMVNSIIINTSETITVQTQKTIGSCRLEKEREIKHNPKKHSYFAAKPEIYLGTKYKKNYVEIMQLFHNQPNTNISDAGKNPQ
jgi:hypothetical protein